MVDFFTALGAVAALIVVALFLSLGLILRALVRANRVARGRRSHAPLSWLASLRAPARLHRRLRRAVGVAEFAVGTVAPAGVVLRDVAGELVERAVTLDDYLVAAQGLYPVARLPRIAQLTKDVREVEMSAARLHQLSCEWRRCLDLTATPLDPAIPDMHQRLDAVETALRELSATPPFPSQAPLPPTPTAAVQKASHHR